ncbi:hypothetical protein GEMRC1_001993 [Eukaryota sp. GEM-RC1]
MLFRRSLRLRLRRRSRATRLLVSLLFCISLATFLFVFVFSSSDSEHYANHSPHSSYPTYSPIKTPENATRHVHTSPESSSLPPGKLPYKGGTIDAVVTFVNGSDPAWQAARRERLKSMGRTYTEEFQWKDNNELVYCLRGLWHNVPQLRHVWLVIASPTQIPTWLDMNNPYISVVYHDEIFPNPEHLPSFSSYAIESNLWRIPHLSDDFIYLNDDFFIVNELPDALVRDLEGYMQIHVDHHKINRPTNQFRRGLINAGRILTRRFGRPKGLKTWYSLAHTFYVCNKPIMKETSEVFSHAYLELNKNPFRTVSGLPHFIFLAGHYYVQRTIETKHSGEYKARYHKCFEDEYVYWNWSDTSYKKNDRYIALVKKLRPVSVCINDDQATRTPSMHSYFLDTVNGMFPEAAGWEKKSV